MSKQLAIRPETIEALDKAADSYQKQVTDASPFRKTFVLAQAMNEMRALLTPEVMEPIMALQNTDLGFRTDKDPKVWDSKTNAYNKPYPVEVVRDVVIEATLRGLYVVNNEFNIIAGRCYAAKNGLRRRVQKYKGLTDLRETYGVPRNVGDKGAIVNCTATWLLGGIKDEIAREIPVRVNASMGTDAILGKAQRKLMASILDRISGEFTPEGEIEDDGSTSTVAEKPKTTIKGNAKTPPTVEVKTETVSTPTEGAAHEVTTTPGESPSSPQQQATPPAQGDNADAMTEEEKRAIEAKEADQAEAEERARELGNDPAGVMVKVMAVDGMTNEELHAALSALGIKAPRNFKGPDSLLPDVIRGLLKGKAWDTVRNYVLNRRDEAKRQNPLG